MDIFISYKSEDRELVLKIKQLIEQETNASCWMDVEGIENTEYFINVIQRAIDESKKMFLMVSEKTHQSEWIRKETLYAQKKGKVITPIILDGKEMFDWLEFVFIDVQCVDYLDAKKFSKFIKKLKEEYPKPITKESLKSYLESETIPPHVLDLLQLGWKYYVRRDYDVAIDFFYRAALLGHADAQYRMGLCYLSNRGINQNNKEAVHWFKEAANHQHPDAMFKLAICYSRGSGVVIQWFLKAAHLGHVLSMFNVGQCYEFGRGSKQDLEEARKWYLEAATRDNEDSLERLRVIGFNN